jgi:hypothetical protein
VLVVYQLVTRRVFDYAKSHAARVRPDSASRLPIEENCSQYT